VNALENAEQDNLSFLRTPGAGDSEGGEIYAPASAGQRGSSPEGLQPKLQFTTRRSEAELAKNA
jgi:hypothetical protein